MVGDWKAEPTEFRIGEMTMMVTSSMTISWEGQFLKTKGINDFGGLVMTELMLLGYDAKSEKYRSSAYTNLSPDPRIEEGALKGDVLVMTSKPWAIMGDDSISRATLTKKSDDEVHFKLEFKMGGGDFELASEATYTRVKK
jgi:hypothetical protein